ncbi:Eco57I restriction-modification methylase domain-containing protein [Halpernia sp.]|uniref:Eco57I restriction-modification methylase domain-containing protein n=1 Tax=Halpernia sp. TaxID=2782209 RepID=UPI003A8D3C52
MDKTKKNKFKLKQIELLIRTTEYAELLSEVSHDIYTESKNAENEASIVSIFELELFSFIKETLGLKYYPEKEKTINTERHISKGRIDSKIGALVIEFKHTSKLKSTEHKEKASSQLVDYLKGLNAKHNLDYFGIVTDGTQCKLINIENGVINEGAFEKLSSKHIDRIIKSIVLLDKIALTPENLVKDFCESDISLSNKLTLCLFNTLKNSPTGRSLMLFNEWKELFRLAHDDNSKQKAIEERKKSLEETIDEELKTNEDEYLALYAIQTTYAIIVKIIAYKVISKIRFNKSLIDFNKLSETDFDTLRHQMNSLEEGAIFRSLGIGNLLEGDFFAWYCSSNQWTNEIGGLVQEIFKILTQYEDKALFQTGENVQDLFRELFMKIIPDKVRHSLGEFYTPSWLADNLIRETINLNPIKKDWTALDPCAGSGTFVTILIKHVLLETINKTKKERLNSVLNRVKAIDLNPLAVLTSRINYFINVSHLISDDDEFEIPVYLGDSSYVPTKVLVDNIECISYSIKTIKGYINIDLPQSAVSNPALFSQTMTSIEQDIHNLDASSIQEKLSAIIPKKDLTEEIKNRIKSLAEQFVDLERNEWNGIWARIVTNFLTTANLGKFDLIVGNPPWIDWKNLPAGYRERVKSICIERHLFSGDSLTGGINLNICALISNVSAMNWLKENGVLAFLMPQTIIFQQTYEGFRQFKLDDSTNLYFQQLFDWTKAGHPFDPVTHKFLTFFFSNKKVDYKKGIPLKYFIKNKGYDLKQYSNFTDFDLLKDVFTETLQLAGQANENSTIFSCAKNEAELKSFSKISGVANYKGREGVEFYPQELFLLEVDTDMPVSKETVIVKNYQNKKSKYKIPLESFPLEKKYLHPLVKGVDIERFNLLPSNYIVPFPYEKTNTRSPISIKDLTKSSKLLATYFNKFKKVFESQTQYNEKIIGEKHNTEFYALARVGEYSFADHYVAFRDNTKWQSCVVSSVLTPWGEKKRPQFQNHAVTISQKSTGEFISLEEAHFICAILNAPVTESYILNSSDSRSFKINPPIYIPEFNIKNSIHKELSELSIKAHKHYADKNEINKIDKRLDELVTKLK